MFFMNLARLINKYAQQNEKASNFYTHNELEECIHRIKTNVEKSIDHSLFKLLSNIPSEKKEDFLSVAKGCIDLEEMSSGIFSTSYILAATRIFISTVGEALGSLESATLDSDLSFLYNRIGDQITDERLSIKNPFDIQEELENVCLSAVKEAFNTIGLVLPKTKSTWGNPDKLVEINFYGLNQNEFFSFLGAEEVKMKKRIEDKFNPTKIASKNIRGINIFAKSILHKYGQEKSLNDRLKEMPAVQEHLESHPEWMRRMILGRVLKIFKSFTLDNKNLSSAEQQKTYSIAEGCFELDLLDQNFVQHIADEITISNFYNYVATIGLRRDSKSPYRDEASKIAVNHHSNLLKPYLHKCELSIVNSLKEAFKSINKPIKVDDDAKHLVKSLSIYQGSYTYDIEDEVKSLFKYTGF